MKDFWEEIRGFAIFMVGVIVVVGLGMTWVILASNVADAKRIPDSNCLYVTYQDNHIFSSDTDYSGVYCPAQP